MEILNSLEPLEREFIEKVRFLVKEKSLDEKTQESLEEDLHEFTRSILHRFVVVLLA